MSAPSSNARFVHGSLMRHIVVMSFASAIGMMALFLVDMVDMYFISLLGHLELAAAIGFAGSVVFFNMSISIGCSIAMSALVSRAIGAQDLDLAKKRCTSTILFSLVLSSVLTSVIVFYIGDLLSLMGAKGIVAEKARDYLMILVPVSPILAVAMAATAALRAVGDAKQSMIAIILGGITNAIFDPILIFGFDMGIKGAAWASVLSRIVIFIVSFRALLFRHHLLESVSWARFKKDLSAISWIAIPAIISNAATPIGNAFSIRVLADFGDDYIAGFAVIGRIIPIAFALLFALSGAVGPIIGQNYGAQRMDRVRTAVRNAVWVVILYTIVISSLIWLVRFDLPSIFNLTGVAKEIMIFFCSWVTFTYGFIGIQFISNAVFTNLNRPIWATLINVGKATIGTIPFVIVGARMGGPEGVLLGQVTGATVFSVLAYLLALKRIRVVTEEMEPKQEELISTEPAMPMTPFCSSKIYMYEEAAVDLEDEKNQSTE